MSLAQETWVIFFLNESQLHKKWRFVNNEGKNKKNIINKSFSFQSALDEATDPWGVQVERVEVKDVRVPENLQRAMAAEAEAARNARAKVIAAEGEHKSSRALRHAAEVIMDSPAALQVGHTSGERR